MPNDILAIEQWKRTPSDRDRLLGNIKIRLFLLGATVAQEHDRISKQFGILGSEMLILFALRRSGGSLELRPTDLFKSLLLPSATMARHLRRLEKLRLIKRRNNPNDRRGFLFGLTSRGIEVADRALKLASSLSAVHSALVAMRKNDRVVLDRLLADLLTQMSKATPEMQPGPASSRAASKSDVADAKFFS